MCTAFTYEHYFCRNLDLDYSYQETVTITPRHYKLSFRKAGTLTQHYAIIGMAYVVDGYPLYYDGVNEYGLAMAGLNFPGNAYYHEPQPDMDNLAPYELIPWILGTCKDMKEARTALERICMVNVPYSESLPLPQLHFIISDREKSITVEPVKEGIKVYDNPVEVLTNNPAFEYHLHHLSDYLGVSAKQPGKCFGNQIELELYSRGMGAIGLPGDWSSASRFVRAAFVKWNGQSGDSERECVNQCFHMLDAVAHPRGCVEVESGKYQITVYSCCCNLEKGIYYYTTYENRRIIGIDMHSEDLEGDELVVYPLLSEDSFLIQNKMYR